jgi:putative colanic acid biosynthesis UDP-glucose lipid carrier transferase
MISDSTEFAKVVKYYKIRYSIKPGITGMAQVKGYRGSTINFFDVSHRCKWDLFYVRNRSFALDMNILRLTVISMISTVYTGFIQKNAGAVKEEFILETPEYLN